MNAAEPLLGYRVLQPTRGGYSGPYYTRQHWVPGINEARCLAADACFEPPVESCDCGWYAWHDFSRLQLSSDQVAVAVIGWGPHSCVHSQLWRTGFVQVVAVLDFTYTPAARDAADYFQVPCLPSPTFFSYAREHGRVRARQHHPQRFFNPTYLEWYDQLAAEVGLAGQLLKIHPDPLRELAYTTSSPVRERLLKHTLSIVGADTLEVPRDTEQMALEALAAQLLWRSGLPRPEVRIPGHFPFDFAHDYHGLAQIERDYLCLAFTPEVFARPVWIGPLLGLDPWQLMNVHQRLRSLIVPSGQSPEPIEPQVPSARNYRALTDDPAPAVSRACDPAILYAASPWAGPRRSSDTSSTAPRSTSRPIPPSPA